MCGLFWGAHKSLAPRARTLLGGLGQATLSFFAVATLLFVFFCECPKFCDLAKQRRKIFGGISEVGKDDFSLYFFWRCVIFLVFYFSSAAIARHHTRRAWTYKMNMAHNKIYCGAVAKYNQYNDCFGNVSVIFWIGLGGHLLTT